MKRFIHVGVSFVGFGLASLTMTGGCSSNPEVASQTEEVKAREKKEMEELNKANDASAKAAAQRR